jgi:hypothetical protein
MLFKSSTGCGALNRPMCLLNRREITLQQNVAYIVKSRVQTDTDQSCYRVKVWPEKTNEPAAWQLAAHGIEGELESGSVLFVARHTDVIFGDFSAIPLKQPR